MERRIQQIRKRTLFYSWTCRVPPPESDSSLCRSTESAGFVFAGTEQCCYRTVKMRHILKLPPKSVASEALFVYPARQLEWRVVNNNWKGSGRKCSCPDWRYWNCRDWKRNTDGRRPLRHENWTHTEHLSCLPIVSHLGAAHVFETLLSRCRGEKMFESQTMQVASFGSPLVGELQIYGRGWERGSTPCILTRNNVLCRL